MDIRFAQNQDIPDILNLLEQVNFIHHQARPAQGLAAGFQQGLQHERLHAGIHRRRQDHPDLHP